MEIAVAPDGRVLIVERAGVVKVLRPGERDPVVAGRIEVFHELEDGLLGIALDPAFASNGWVYLFHSDPATRVVEGVGKMGDNIEGVRSILAYLTRSSASSSGLNDGERARSRSPRRDGDSRGASASPESL